MVVVEGRVHDGAVGLRHGMEPGLHAVPLSVPEGSSDGGDGHVAGKVS